MNKKSPRHVSVQRFERERREKLYPDDCECDARDRGSCIHACAPLPWPPTGVNVTRWHGRMYGGKLEDQVRQLAAIRNAVYNHPHDFRTGMVVYWMRDRKVRSGVVVEVTGNNYQPAVVRSAGHPRRFHYKPTIYAYCDADGNKPSTCSEYDGPPGVKLMQSHSPAALAGVRNPQLEAYAAGMTLHNAKVIPGLAIQGSMMGPDEYGTLGGPDDFSDGGRPRPWQFQIAEYQVRESRKGNGQWGIYLRDYNVRLAVFSPNSFALRDALDRGFDAAHTLKKKRIAEFKETRLPISKQIKRRQAAERKRSSGWYQCQCGQWVNDKTSPCSVCKPKRKPRKKK